MNTKHAKNALRVILLFVLTTLIQACAGRIDHIELSPGDSIQRGNSLRAYVAGTGDCSAIRIKWGDGSFSDTSVMKSSTNQYIVSESHTYGYWGGPKTVTAEGLSNCVGQAQARIVVEPQIYSLAFCAGSEDCSAGAPGAGQMSAASCGALTSVPPIRQNAIVTITTASTVINFGCFADGCIYGSNGELNSVAPAGYPFPGLRKYSLVIRLGPQVVQGSNNFTFTAENNAVMEVCANDNEPDDDTGGWVLFIQVDESGS